MCGGPPRVFPSVMRRKVGWRRGLQESTLLAREASTPERVLKSVFPRGRAGPTIYFAALEDWDSQESSRSQRTVRCT